MSMLQTTISSPIGDPHPLIASFGPDSSPLAFSGIGSIGYVIEPKDQNIIAFNTVEGATLAITALGLDPDVWMPYAVGEPLPIGRLDTAVVFYRPTGGDELSDAVRWVSDLKRLAGKVMLL